MGTLPSQFLQVRDLHPETTAQHIVTAITKLQGVQIRRLLLLEGREDEHVPVAFVEFQDSAAAAQALALAAALPGKGFSVKGKPAGLSFIHVGVFVPVYGNVEPGVFKATDSSQLLAYWNTEYRCSVFIPENAIPEAEVDSDESRKRKDGNEHARRKKAKALGTGVTVKSGSGGMISHWSKKQEELNEAIAPSVKHTSYADLKIMACLLCSRKFKTEAEIDQHESQSELHRKNLDNSTLVAKADERVRARDPDALRPPQPPPLPPTTDQQDNIVPEYRNRALERRIQIKQAGGTIEVPTAKHKRPEPRSLSPPADRAAKAESKGRQLMNKMGYVSGGLGSTGQGRSDIVKAETYLPGVGLGSQGGKLDDREAEARRGTGSYSEFVASVKENARSRYDREQGIE
ncbi:Rna-binding protein [Taphrina deformans PYCC 5710]|uniref:Rna-binding protein n=1 Tax=Taphrina deformans (strain PYCC 5710 / ATCC 11124 / CBS 356.35 / IMI 108563 / JCM 9778 / NBRC 8474) TaxID=1097556 RepID=R4XI06_TAPDE|nr:Rna-binding protein [Taphrina deformans PYCC 5710]|eukprot:CCG83032.1 Rna-binding protein [Taphrina deformans PYCC 5710]